MLLLWGVELHVVVDAVDNVLEVVADFHVTILVRMVVRVLVIMDVSMAVKAIAKEPARTVLRSNT